MSVYYVIHLQSFLPVEEILSLTFIGRNFDAPPVDEAVCALSVQHELQVKQISTGLGYLGLGPPTAPAVIINDSINQVPDLEVLPPVLVLAPEIFKLVFRYLVVVVVKDRIIFEDHFDTVEKLLVEVPGFQLLQEDQQEALQHSSYCF